MCAAILKVCCNTVVLPFLRWLASVRNIWRGQTEYLRRPAPRDEALLQAHAWAARHKTSPGYCCCFCYLQDHPQITSR